MNLLIAISLVILSLNTARVFAQYSAVPGNCQEFTQQANGITYTFTCGGGTVFNPASQECDWPNNVPGCSGAPATSATSAPTTAAANGSACTCTTPACLEPSGGCSQTFYQCGANGVLVAESCPAGTVFDSSLYVCNWPSSVAACPAAAPPATTVAPPATTVAPPGTTTVPVGPPTTGPATIPTLAGTVTVAPLTSASAVTTAPAAGSTCTCSTPACLQESSGCSGSFYQCSNGVLVAESCPAGTVFDPSLLVCNWPSSVATCTAAATTTVPTSGSACTCTTPACLSPDSSSCSNFYQCANGVLVTESCPSGTVFDPTLLVCNWPYSVSGPCYSAGK